MGYFFKIRTYVPISLVSSFGSKLVFVQGDMELSIYINVSRNSILSFENLKSNLTGRCF